MAPAQEKTPFGDVGLKGVHAKSPDEGNRAPTRAPLFPSCILEKMSLATRGSLFGMRLGRPLRLSTRIGEAFERNWATCQQLADEGTQQCGDQIFQGNCAISEPPSSRG